jgi:hypothetical protein
MNYEQIDKYNKALIKLGELGENDVGKVLFDLYNLLDSGEIPNLDNEEKERRLFNAFESIINDLSRASLRLSKEFVESFFKNNKDYDIKTGNELLSSEYLKSEFEYQLNKHKESNKDEKI